jgi:hypothetical protein
VTPIDFPAEGIDVGNRAGFISQMINEGYSANEGLELLQSQGAGYRRSDFLADWGRVSDLLARQDVELALDPTALPDASEYGEIAMGRGGQYATRVSIGIVNMDTGVNGTGWYLHVTDEPHTPEDAIEGAMDAFSDENTTRYRERITSLIAGVPMLTVPYE